MGRCERCGADALNVHGICRNCGWQAPSVEYDDRPSIGETRAADAFPGFPNSGAPYTRGTSLYPGPAPSSDPTQMRQPPSGPGAAGPSSRFCGVCGARIVGNEMYCGQCGAPVNGDPGTVEAPAGMGRYGAAQQWGMDDADAYTEALPGPMTVGGVRTPYGSSDPYGRAYQTSYGSSSYGPGATPAPQQQGGLSRNARITLGAVFLGASVISAIIVITLAVMWF